MEVRVEREGEFPLVLRATREGSQAQECDVFSWLERGKVDLRRIVERDGALLLRGFDQLSTPERWERVARLFCDDLVDYVGGTSPRKVVSGRVMTATEIAASFSIPVHQEMSYTLDPPDKVFFFCERPASRGGATLLCDMRRVTARLGSLQTRFMQAHLRLRRALPPAGAEGKKAGIQKAWQEVFGTDDREEVRSVAAQRGWEVNFIAENFLLLSQDLCPAYRTHKHTGQNVWFNQMHIFPPSALIAWAVRDGRKDDVVRLQKAIHEELERMDQVVDGEGHPVSEDDVRTVNDILLEEARPVHWTPGDILILDNTLFGHGREVFQGERLLYAALGRDR